MNSDEKFVMRVGCGCLLLGLVFLPLFYGGIVWGAIAIIHALHQ